MNRTFRNFGKSITSGKNKFVLVGFIIVAIVLSLVLTSPSLSIAGSYSNAYEGAKPSFAGVSYNGVNYAVNQPGSLEGYRPYVALNGMGFSFKGDGPTSYWRGLPKVVGEMTPVFIPQKTGPGDLPSQFDIGGVKVNNPFTGSFSAINNPYHTYSWAVSKGTYKTFYTMEEWKTKFYVSISANPDGASAPFNYAQWDQGNGRYSDVTIWVKLDTTPTWYFQGQDKAYFAIAQVQLSAISYAGHNPDGTVQPSHNQQNIAVNPSSPSSACTLYTRNFGAGANEATDPEQIYSYKGKTLNPQYFGNSVYFPITLNNFGSQSWWDWATFKAQGDVVSFDFTVTQFVVGQWTVQNTQPTPNGYGRQSSYSEYGLSGVTDFLNNFGSNPLYLLIVLGIIIIIIAGIIAWKVPELFKAANAGIGAARKKVGKAYRSKGKGRKKR